MPDSAARELPPEDVYGHAKKVRFFRETIDAERARKGRRLKVLDFGCGSGDAVARYLAGDDLDYTGVDIHPPSLAYAREHFSGPTTRFLDHLPAGETYDVIVYGDVLEHIDDPAALLREHVGLLAGDGVIVGSVPNGYGGFENERRLDRLLRLSDIARGVVRGLRRVRGRPAANPTPNPVPFNEGSPHVVFFTRRSLCETLGAAGLEIVHFAHGSFVGADLSGSTVLTPRLLIDLNARIADHLPSWAVSTWHFAARPKGHREDQAGVR